MGATLAYDRHKCDIGRNAEISTIPACFRNESNPLLQAQRIARLPLQYPRSLRSLGYCNGYMLKKYKIVTTGSTLFCVSLGRRRPRLNMIAFSSPLTIKNSSAAILPVRQRTCSHPQIQHAPFKPLKELERVIPCSFQTAESTVPLTRCSVLVQVPEARTPLTRSPFFQAAEDISSHLRRFRS